MSQLEDPGIAQPKASLLKELRCADRAMDRHGLPPPQALSRLQEHPRRLPQELALAIGRDLEELRTAD